MNRLEAPSSLQAPVSLPLPSVAQAIAGAEDQRFEWPSETRGAATFTPLHYEEGYAYPLVVWLHGGGQSEQDLAPFMAHLSTRNYVGVAPESVGEAMNPWPQTEQGVAGAEQRVLDAISLASDRFNVHPDRVFLAGLGAGGTAALRIALSMPGCFAGAASLDGPAPIGHTPLWNLKQVRGLPLMLSTGRKSQQYPEAQVCRDLRLLYSAGCSLTIRQEPGDGALTTSMLAELDRWMMGIVCGEQVASR